MRNLKHRTPPPTHRQETKRLPFHPPLDGISDQTLTHHYDKLYASYVDKKNEIENRLEAFGRTFVPGDGKHGNASYSELRALKDGETHALNGVYLHEWYFEVLGGDGKCEHARELVAAITETYTSVESFINYFSECAIASRGWTILAWNAKESRLWIYNCDSNNEGAVWGALPIIVLDVYEHA